MRLIDADKIPYVDLSDGRKVCFAAFADKINQMPTIEPEQHWIPLADKEPTEEGEYLVTFDDGFVVTTGYYDGDFELWADAGEPIAWMPLPEPYEEVRDD